MISIHCKSYILKFFIPDPYLSPESKSNEIILRGLFTKSFPKGTEMEIKIC